MRYHAVPLLYDVSIWVERVHALSDPFHLFSVSGLSSRCHGLGTRLSGSCISEIFARVLIYLSVCLDASLKVVSPHTILPSSVGYTSLWPEQLAFMLLLKALLRKPLNLVNLLTYYSLMSRLDVGEHVSLRANTDRARPIISRLLFELLERTRVKLHALVTSPTQASHIQVCDGFRLDAGIDSIVSISIDHELIVTSAWRVSLSVMVHEHLLILHAYNTTEYLWLCRSHLSPVLPLDLACVYGEVQVTALKVLALLVQSQLIFRTLLIRFPTLLVFTDYVDELLAFTKLDLRI